MSREIIVPGGDACFFPYLHAAVTSLRSHPAVATRDIGVIDQGLTIEQRAQLAWLDCRLVVPEWTVPVPIERRDLRSIGLISRTALRDYFPDYEIYLWFDADAWAQTSEFIVPYIEGARVCGAAVATEDGAGYRRTWRDLRWWAGNMVASFGACAGIRCSLTTSINIGVLCLASTAPHWEAWTRFYARALARTGKVNMDQHAFLAAVHLEGLDTAFLPARFNWLPHLSCPVWNARTGLLCEPQEPYRPLSVIHLAGPRKDRPYRVACLDDTTQLAMCLTYPAVQLHRATTAEGDRACSAAPIQMFPS